MRPMSQGITKAEKIMANFISQKAPPGWRPIPGMVVLGTCQCGNQVAGRVLADEQHPSKIPLAITRSGVAVRVTNGFRVCLLNRIRPAQSRDPNAWSCFTLSSPKARRERSDVVVSSGVAAR